MAHFTLKALTASVLAAASFGAAHAAEFTLRYAHFWPSNSTAHTEVFQKWAESVEKASDGRIKVEIYPAQTLAKADGSYQAMVNGVADIVTVVQGYTAGRFPLTQIAELPNIGRSALQTGCVLQSLHDQGLLKDEYKDSHVLYMFSTGPGALHTRDKAVAKPDDFRGLRMRSPSVVAGEVLQGVGARTVSMPAPEAYESMQRGVIDGTAFPWEGALVFRLLELSNNHVEVPLYSTVFVTAMNNRTYNRLPADLKKVIDDHSGPEWQKRAAAVFDGLDAKGRELAVKNGNTIVTIEEPMADPAWGPVLKKVTDDYLNSLKTKGMPADKVYEAAVAARAQCPLTPAS